MKGPVEETSIRLSMNEHLDSSRSFRRGRSEIKLNYSIQQSITNCQSVTRERPSLLCRSQKTSSNREGLHSGRSPYTGAAIKSSTPSSVNLLSSFDSRVRPRVNSSERSYSGYSRSRKRSPASSITDLKGRSIDESSFEDNLNTFSDRLKSLESKLRLLERKPSNFAIKPSKRKFQTATPSKKRAMIDQVPGEESFLHKISNGHFDIDGEYGDYLNDCVDQYKCAINAIRSTCKPSTPIRCRRNFQSKNKC